MLAISHVSSYNNNVNVTVGENVIENVTSWPYLGHNFPIRSVTTLMAETDWSDQ